tara:strand:- start:236 stop:439 length:204 start_codon:yes stop_codon:yes gene_type:complete
MAKMKYEVFNAVTGKFEEGVLDEEEAMKAIESFRNDYETYEAEKCIIETLIDMQMNHSIHPKLGNLD